MKYFLISDNIDTYTGMRLAGIEGVVVASPAEAREAVSAAIADKQIGILLVTEKCADFCPDLIYRIKTQLKTPLLVEMPDRHGSRRPPDKIMRYLKEAIGVKV